MRPKIFATRPLPAAVLDLLQARCELTFHPEDSPLAPAQLAECLRKGGEVDGLLVMGARVTEVVLDQAPKLRVVSNASVGYDNIDVEACTRRRIPVTNTPGVLTDTTADLAFALLLAVARRVAEGDHFVREGRWKHWQWGLLHGTDVHHKTLGLYGLGRIGQAVARRGRGFSMRVLYHARHRAPGALENELEVRYVDREALLRESDFLSLHVPLTDETRHLLRAPDLALMKPTAILINTARGTVVDEQALVQALESGKMAGAGLDVFEREPQIPRALLEMPNVVLLPHIGSATAETRFKMAKLAAENLLAALDGLRPPNLVNVEIYS